MSIRKITNFENHVSGGNGYFSLTLVIIMLMEEDLLFYSDLLAKAKREGDIQSINFYREKIQKTKEEIAQLRQNPHHGYYF